MKKHISSILFSLFFLIFIAVMDYPYISQLINEYNSSKVINNYKENVKSKSEEEKETFFKEAKKYNAQLDKYELADAFENSDIMKNEIPAEPVGIIEMPRIEIKLPVYKGTTEEVLQNGAGVLEGTSLPVGGKGTHATLCAHRAIPGKRLFTDLDMVTKGDTFTIDIMGTKIAYQVFKIETVLPAEVEALKIENDRDLVTLMTCTPYGVNTHRIYVHGERIPLEDAGEPKLEVIGFFRKWWWIGATVILLGIMIYMLTKPAKRGKKAV